MVEVLLVSAKAGAAKAGLTASFAELADRPVIANCETDSTGLDAILDPKILERHEFYNGHQAVIRADECICCGVCLRYCPNGAITVSIALSGSETYSIAPERCQDCGSCNPNCPVDAIGILERSCGEWMISDTRFGPMIHARASVPNEKSAVLVSTIRQEAWRVAFTDHRGLLIVNGPSGAGSPVIASVAGASKVLIVTEPTDESACELEHLLALTGQFHTPAAVCVNKWDLDAKLTNHIEKIARANGIRIVGRIRRDTASKRIPHSNRDTGEPSGSSAEDIRRLWEKFCS